MKYLTVLAAFLCLAVSAAAREYSVFSVVGRAERYDKGVWQTLSRREKLTDEDLVRIGENSALNLLDDTSEKVYSLGQSGTRRIGELVNSTRKSLLSKFFAYFRKALMRGDTDRASDDATVVYRDTGCDAAVAAALTDPGYRSPRPLSLALVNADTGVEFRSEAGLGRDFFFRIRNDAAEPLFVNVLAIEPDGSMEPCITVDRGFTLSHLLIPAGATVDLNEYRFTLCPPPGEMHFVLVACDEPFDLFHVVRLISEGLEPDTEAGTTVGIFRKTIVIR